MVCGQQIPRSVWSFTLVAWVGGGGPLISLPVGRLQGSVSRLHPIMWSPGSAPAPVPVSAPGPPRHIGNYSRWVCPGWGPACAWAVPSLGFKAPWPLLDRRRLWCSHSQDEGRRGGHGRTGPAEPGGGQPRGLRHVPGVRAPRLPGPYGGQSALSAGAQLAPPLPQPS